MFWGSLNGDPSQTIIFWDDRIHSTAFWTHIHLPHVELKLGDLSQESRLCMILLWLSGTNPGKIVLSVFISGYPIPSLLLHVYTNTFNGGVNWNQSFEKLSVCVEILPQWFIGSVILVALLKATEPFFFFSFIKRWWYFPTNWEIVEANEITCVNYLIAWQEHCELQYMRTVAFISLRVLLLEVSAHHWVFSKMKKVFKSLRKYNITEMHSLNFMTTTIYQLYCIRWDFEPELLISKSDLKGLLYILDPSVVWICLTKNAQ